MKKIIVLLFIINSLYGVMINGIDWQDESINESYRLSFIDAKKYCKKKSARLPTVNELSNLQENIFKIRYLEYDYYISSSGKFVNFYDGRVVDSYSHHFAYVRCVFKNYMKNGAYTIKLKNGAIEKGTYKNGGKNGPFTIKYSNGDLIKGTYTINKMNNAITLIYKNGDILKGHFNHGELFGAYELKNTNGYTEKGTYKDGKKNGPYQIKYKNGDIEIGNYINGKKVKNKIIYHKIIKGYLKEDFIITLKDCDDVIYKDTLIEINLNTMKIVEPENYDYIVLKEIPVVYIPKDKREINIESSVKHFHNKDFISFLLTTNVKIKSISYNNKNLKITNNQDYLYKTKPIRKKDSYNLKLMLDDGSEIIYKCVDKDCTLKQKVEID